MKLRARSVLGMIRRAPVLGGIAGGVLASLVLARELGLFLPDSVAMGLAMFPGGFIAGLVARPFLRRSCTGER
jgi:hypothetical protein